MNDFPAHPKIDFSTLGGTIKKKHPCLRNTGTRAELVIFRYYSPRKRSELIETDLWGRLKPLTHYTPSSPCSSGPVKNP